MFGDELGPGDEYAVIQRRRIINATDSRILSQIKNLRIGRCPRGGTEVGRSGAVGITVFVVRREAIIHTDANANAAPVMVRSRVGPATKDDELMFRIRRHRLTRILTSTARCPS